jgi:hypothetical protein
LTVAAASSSGGGGGGGGFDMLTLLGLAGVGIARIHGLRKRGTAQESPRRAC